MTSRLTFLADLQADLPVPCLTNLSAELPTAGCPTDLLDGLQMISADLPATLLAYLPGHLLADLLTDLSAYLPADHSTLFSQILISM